MSTLPAMEPRPLGFPGFSESVPLEVPALHGPAGVGAVGPVRGRVDGRLLRDGRRGAQLRPPGPARRVLEHRRRPHRRGALDLLLGRRTVGGAVPAVRQPPRPRLPGVLTHLRPRHLRPHQVRGGRGQDRPGTGRGQPFAVRHVHRPLVRAGTRSPRREAVSSATSRRPQPMPARPPAVVHRRPRTRGRALGRSACARTATTPRRRSSGSGTPPSCGGAPPSPCAAPSPPTSG